MLHICWILETAIFLPTQWIVSPYLVHQTSSNGQTNCLNLCYAIRCFPLNFRSQINCCSTFIYPILLERESSKTTTNLAMSFLDYAAFPGQTIVFEYYRCPCLGVFCAPLLRLGSDLDAFQQLSPLFNL